MLSNSRPDLYHELRRKPVGSEPRGFVRCQRGLAESHPHRDRHHGPGQQAGGGSELDLQLVPTVRRGPEPAAAESPRTRQPLPADPAPAGTRLGATRHPGRRRRHALGGRDPMSRIDGRHRVPAGHVPGHRPGQLPPGGRGHGTARACVRWRTDGFALRTYRSSSSPGFSTGCAGVATCLLRLAHPRTRPHLLSLRGLTGSTP